MLNMEDQYLQHMDDILHYGEAAQNRTGIETISIFGHQMRCDLRRGFPILTTKSIHWKSVVHELLWFLSGDTNIKYLKDNNVRIWDEWADEDGNLGPVYGHQWRDFGGASRVVDEAGNTVSYGVEGVDQISQVIQSLMNDPDSRRHIVSAWNPVDLPEMKLAPCHVMFQLNAALIPMTDLLDQIKAVDPDYAESAYRNIMKYGELRSGCPVLAAEIMKWEHYYTLKRYHLDLQMYQRSADWFLGVPFNIASYALLQSMIAHVTNMIPRHFIHTFGDSHLYENHLDQVQEQLSRAADFPPKLILNDKVKSLDDFVFDDIKLSGYDPQPAIKAEVAV